MESAKREVSLFMEFQNKLDEEVVGEAKKGGNRTQDYLVSEYENFVKVRAESCFLVGVDKEDIY